MHSMSLSKLTGALCLLFRWFVPRQLQFQAKMAFAGKFGLVGRFGQAKPHNAARVNRMATRVRPLTLSQSSMSRRAPFAAVPSVRKVSSFAGNYDNPAPTFREAKGDAAKTTGKHACGLP